MKKRKLGKTAVEVTPIALGAWAIGGWMWGGTDREDSLRAIRASHDHGITTIDTAPIYGFGLSEEIVGEAIRGKRDQFEILTKCGMRWEGTRGEYYFTTDDNDGNKRDIYKYSGKQSLINECEESLKRLGTDYIDLFQIHWPDHTTPIEEAMEAFSLLLQQGKIRAAGVCNYSLGQMKRAAGAVELASNQMPYSMVRRDIEEDIVPWCLENQCSILAYSPLQRGLLTGKITPDYSFAPGDTRPDTAHFRNSNIIKINDFLNEIRPIAEAKGATLAQLVIQWTLQQPGITVALVGARNDAQVNENVGALNLELSSEELESITRQLDGLDLDLN
jgi:aryl-alcohol dehydrogenase-like predicted oxidoreductase